jgi:hypothetical protein
MIGDHHGRMAWRATLLVRAMDGILGRAWWLNATPLDGAVTPIRSPGQRGAG